MAANAAGFLESNEENGDYNQYWYSALTIKRIVADLVENPGKIGFLSTPSLYFSLPDGLRNDCFVFDFDKKWESDRGFVHYDFNAPDNLPSSLFGTFDVVVIDPPFITREVWEKYAVAAHKLLKPGHNEDGTARGRVILTTIFENAALLDELFGAKPTAFLPSIPNLIYQYNLYTNYPSVQFSTKNPEIPE